MANHQSIPSITTDTTAETTVGGKQVGREALHEVQSSQKAVAWSLTVNDREGTPATVLQRPMRLLMPAIAVS